MGCQALHPLGSQFSQGPQFGRVGVGAEDIQVGAYFVLYPHARVVTLVPLFFLFPLVEVPAFLFLLVWFLFQFWQGSAALVSSGRAGAAAGGVAWWAHVGGFVAGIALLALLKPRRRPAPRAWIQ